MGSYEIVVVGGGLAGLTAGLFAARCGRATLVLESAVPGGHLVNITKIEDYPGFPGGVAGYELAPALQEQAARYGAEFDLAEVEGIMAEDDRWLVRTSAGQHRSGAVIVASGSRPRLLGVPGEARLSGRGVSHCASCDGPLFRGQTVGVVGGGDSALQEALTLAEHAAEVRLFHRRATLRGQHTYQRRIGETRRINVCLDTIVEEVLGDTEVTGIRVRHAVTGVTAEVALSGLFVYVGLVPNTDFLTPWLSLDPAQRIPTDVWMRTERPGLFAAGDIRRDSASQAIAAAGDGATAAIAAHRYLDERRWPA